MTRRPRSLTRSLTRSLGLAVAGSMVALLAACGSGSDPAAGPTDEDGLYGNTRAPSKSVTTPLIDTSGRPFVLGTDLDRRVNLVFFGYTNCPDICSAVMGTLASSLKKLDATVRDQVQVVFVSTDPQRDTPEVVQDYLDRFNSDFIGLTTDVVDPRTKKKDVTGIVDIGMTYGIAIDKNPQLVTGGYDIIHQDQISGVNTAGEVTTVWNRDVTQTELAHDLAKLVKQ